MDQWAEVIAVGSSAYEGRRPGLSVHELEADVAYFDARLALLAGQPVNHYQEAQLRVYGELEEVLSGMLKRLRGETRIASNGAGVEVEELLLKGAE